MRILPFTGLAAVFLVSLAALLDKLGGMAAIGESMPMLTLWLGATVLSGAGVGFLIARIFTGQHPENRSWSPTAANWDDVMDSMPIGLAVFDSDRQLAYCNRQWRKLLADLEGAAKLGSLYDDIMIRVAGTDSSGDLADRFAGNRQIDAGTWARFGEVNLADGSVLVSATDSTGEHLRAAEARSELERSRLIISAAGAWIWETDVLHRFSLVVPVHGDLNPDEFYWMIGHSIDELASPVGVAGDTVLSRYVEDMREHRRLSDASLNLQDGRRTRTVRLSGVPRTDGDGVFLGYCGVGAFDSARAEPVAVPVYTAPLRDIVPSKAAGQRVLLVDDSQTNRLLGVSILEKMGYECDAVENGEQAVTAVREERYGLVLMDIRMPGMDGFEATARIRRLPEPGGSVPVVAMTAHVNAEDRQLCLEAGMDDHVAKPVDRRVLTSVLRRLIGSPESGGSPPDEYAADEIDASPAENATVVDSATLKQLRDDAGPDLVSELIASFMSETDERLLRMQAATPAGDFESVATDAHAMKSSSGTFGALRLQSLAERLEAAASASDASLVSELLDVLPDLVAESWREFARAGYPPPE
jgi:CheY-like chemotaxis protein/PAS domain-containing protein